MELRALRIAMLGPIAWRTPPRHYGAWETVVHNLTEGLVARGCHVTLFATADSVTSAELVAVCPRGCVAKTGGGLVEVVIVLTAELHRHPVHELQAPL